MNEEIGNRMKIKQRRNKNLDGSDDSRENHAKDDSDSNADSDYVLNSTSIELDYIDQSEKIEDNTENRNTGMPFSRSASSGTMDDDSSERELSSSEVDNGYIDAENYYDVDYSGSDESEYSSDRYYDSSSDATNSHEEGYINFFYGNEAASISETSDLEIVHSVSQRNIAVGQNPQPVRGIRNEEDRDLVVVESINPEEPYPRVTHEIIIMVLGKIYWAYYYVISLDDTGRSLRPDQPNNFGIRSLSDILRSFSPAELGFLKTKIRRILISDFRNPNIVELLVGMIDPNKIDEGFQRTALKSVQYKDLINKESKSCIICYESFKSTSMCVSLKCLHVFHSGCIKSWFNKSYSCPVCRTYNI